MCIDDRCGTNNWAVIIASEILFLQLIDLKGVCDHNYSNTTSASDITEPVVTSRTLKRLELLGSLVILHLDLLSYDVRMRELSDDDRLQQVKGARRTVSNTIILSDAVKRFSTVAN